MDAHTLFNRQWFGKIDTDGIPIAIIVNGEVYARCPRCKMHKHPSDTLLVSSMPKRVCKKCQSKACCDRHYAREGKVKQRPKIIWMQCPRCNQQVKKTQWNRNRKCCNQCGKIERESLRKKPKCKICGKETNGKKYQYCSVKCMTDAKKKRHIVQCVHCQKDMEVQESRYKARSYFLCSEECTLVFNKQRSEHSTQRRLCAMEDRRVQRENEKQQQRLDRELADIRGWVTKIEKCRSVFRCDDSTRWYRKCASALAGMRKRYSVTIPRQISEVSWSLRVSECRDSLRASARYATLTNWEKKSGNASCMLKQKRRFRDATY